MRQQTRCRIGMWIRPAPVCSRVQRSLGGCTFSAAMGQRVVGQYVSAKVDAPGCGDPEARRISPHLSCCAAAGEGVWIAQGQAPCNRAGRSREGWLCDFGSDIGRIGQDRIHNQPDSADSFSGLRRALIANEHVDAQAPGRQRDRDYTAQRAPQRLGSERAGLGGHEGLHCREADPDHDTEQRRTRCCFMYP